MPLEVIRADITKLKLDVIVNSANQQAEIGLGVDKAIHEAAGEMLLSARKEIGEIHTGEAYITKGFQLNAKYVIHTVGPIWEKGDFIEENQLTSCYLNSLNLAVQYRLKSIAFPLISAGAFQCPKEVAFRIAYNAIQTFLFDHDIKVYLCIFDQSLSFISSDVFLSIQSYIDKNYREEDTLFNYGRTPKKSFSKTIHQVNDYKEYFVPKIEVPFQEMLTNLIERSKLKDIDICKRIYMNRKWLSKIRTQVNHQPSKNEVIKLAIALHLNMDETRELLKSLRYTLATHEITDLIISYHIDHKNFDIVYINMTLFEFNQKILC